ncbi:MAG TPA: DNA topoisomerase VI subunit B, partial [Terriglobia bacterium]|nr:DNA topoisomerase VI subunit B [Terriglobia bacterium]
KEITLALREAGRRLGIFLRRRERAASEFRRRNIFDLYIEEVVAACNRLKGGKLPTEKLKEQLHKIASSRTGGLKTDEALGKTGAGPEGLPNSIIVTDEGIEGDIDVAQQAPASAAEGKKPAAVESGTETKARLKSRRGVKDASHIRKSASAGGAKGTVAQQDLFVADRAPAKKRPGLKKKSTAATATRKRK